MFWPGVRLFWGDRGGAFGFAGGEVGGGQNGGRGVGGGRGTGFSLCFDGVDEDEDVADAGVAVGNEVVDGGADAGSEVDDDLGVAGRDVPALATQDNGRGVADLGGEAVGAFVAVGDEDETVDGLAGETLGVKLRRRAIGSPASLDLPNAAARSRGLHAGTRALPGLTLGSRTGGALDVGRT